MTASEYSIRAIVVAVLACPAMAGCAADPDYDRPQSPTPAPTPTVSSRTEIAQTRSQPVYGGAPLSDRSPSTVAL
jgi:hypothetical protein